MKTTQPLQTRAMATLYGPGASKNSTAGGLSNSLTRYYDRRVARLNAKGDSEGVRLARLERMQIEAFAEKRGISGADLDSALSVLIEREDFPLSKQTIEAKRNGLPASRGKPEMKGTVEALRLELGSAEAAQAMLQNYVKCTTALAAEVPSVAARANETGAGEDGRLIRILSKYPDPLPEPKHAA